MFLDKLQAVKDNIYDTLTSLDKVEQPVDISAIQKANVSMTTSARKEGVNLTYFQMQSINVNMITVNMVSVLKQLDDLIDQARMFDSIPSGLLEALANGEMTLREFKDFTKNLYIKQVIHRSGTIVDAAKVLNLSTEHTSKLNVKLLKEA